MSVLSGARADGWITCTICIHHILELLFSLTRLCFDHDGMDVDMLTVNFKYLHQRSRIKYCAAQQDLDVALDEALPFFADYGFVS